MRKHLNPILSLLCLTILLVIPYFVFAQSGGGLINGSSTLDTLNKVAGNGGYAIGEEFNLMAAVGVVIQGALSLLGAIFIIIMVIAGYRWMTASGNEQAVSKATDMIKRAIIGLIITLSSWAIWSFILNSFILK